jgi:transcriptional regulator with PAS, ATPase and Fis domain
VISALRPSGRRLVSSVNGKLLVVDLPERGRLVVGRGGDCDVVLDDASISRRHAAIEVGDDVRVDDLGSANGTTVGGKRVAPGAPVVLGAGVALQLGAILVALEGESEEVESAPASDIVVADPVMLEVQELVRIAAGSPLSVLLLGETGVGKEVFARRIHQLSPRSSGQLVRVNCAALVESLLEAELFGYERGAFTGANVAKAGLLETASGGTLFLDEIGEMPLPTQAKLLRVLESGEVLRVGAVKPRAVDVRFVSATHRDVRGLVASGRFREDLFHRLDGVSIRIPPLRSRPSEIVALAERCIESAAKSYGRTPPSIGPEAAARLTAHPWSGNVRELRNVMQRSVLFSREPVLSVKDLQFDTLGAAAAAPAGSSPAAAAPSDPSRTGVIPPGLSAERLERRQRVLEALEQTVWNQTRAASVLGISRRTLQAWLIELNIPRPRAGR